jgi:glycerate kinase
MAMQHECRSIMVCIGGSATVDGGTGVAQALGFKFFDQQSREITQPMCGGLLSRVARIEWPMLNSPPLRVACDVTNPLCGPNGAAAVYGPQKGASPAQVRQLDEGLANLARLCGGDSNQDGAGAAGGAGFGLATLLGARLEHGIELVLDAIGFSSRCADASLVLTGEGRLDAQSLRGKACMGVAKAAATRRVPAIAIVGSTGPGAEQCLIRHGGFLKSYECLTERFGHERAMHEAATLISDVATELARALK